MKIVLLHTCGSLVIFSDLKFRKWAPLSTNNKLLWVLVSTNNETNNVSFIYFYQKKYEGKIE